ncbi:MAG: hypothetical protein OEY19_01055 [Gammaproteobacteria bacterium]|nr:hypothetical protein [Gammaproteobacteria bacterium]MDH5628864.1 hypothetical protein [Gammaproteobacteria bacterium]
MLIKSGRQFRSYVISLFLLVSGLIALIGGASLYQATENYLFSSLKKEKLNQVETLASLIDGDDHKRIKNSWTFKRLGGEKLQYLMAKSSGSSGNGLKIYSINYNLEDEKFSYAVSSNFANKDTIQIYIYDFEILLTIGNEGAHKFIQNGIEVDSFNEFYNGKTINVQLNHSAEGSFVLVNGHPVLNVKNQQQLSANYKNVQLNQDREDAQRLTLNFGNEKVAVQYRYISSGTEFYLTGAPYISNSDLYKNLLAVMKNSGIRQSVGSIIQDHHGGYAVYAPIFDSANNKIGMVVVEIPVGLINQFSQDIIESMLYSFSLLMVFLMVAAIYFSRKITRPMEKLTDAIDRLIKDDFNFKLSTKGFGRFGFLANQFNQMLQQLQTSRSDLIQLNKAYSRFVPHQLLSQLSHCGVQDIQLGDNCERLMTILFCDIRGFTTISESMSPAENFRFINRYLNKIAPVINKHSGIIDKYMGDGIMALFPTNADDAVKASIDMIKALNEYNQKLVENNLPIIEVGIGLHSGRTMLGTVGTSSRMDATVVSDTVNAASRIESMNKSFSTRILISETTKKLLKDLSKYQIRYIASTEIRGKSQAVTLYEIFDNDAPSVQKEKLRNQTMMIRAWSAYKSGNKEGAIQIYQQLIEKSPLDKSLFALIERCQRGRL